MIKCNVTVCGTITRSAQMRTNKDGKAFLAFGVSVAIPAKSGINKTIEISVAKDGGMDELNVLSSGTRVEIVGVLTFRKKDETIFLNLSATGVNTFNAPGEDRFMHFGQGKPEWMQGKCGIDANGELQLGVYNDRLDITCRVAGLSKWEKQPYQGEGTNAQ